MNGESIQTIVKRGRGRPKGSKNVADVQRWIAARVSPATARELLAMFGERELWRRVVNSEDDRVLLQALMFLTAMRDGKPAQSINVTSTSITLKSEDIERARAIVREIRGDTSRHDTSPLVADVTSTHAQDEVSDGEVQRVDTRYTSGIQSDAASLMLSEGDGGKKGGEGSV